jgi:hypothetical protein
VKETTVYTFDASMHNLVKLEKHGKKWCVYRLEKVEIIPGKHPRFTFEQKPYESWSYEPFEWKDVNGDPETFLDDVKRWQPQLIFH